MTTKVDGMKLGDQITCANTILPGSETIQKLQSLREDLDKTSLDAPTHHTVTVLQTLSETLRQAEKRNKEKYESIQKLADLARGQLQNNKKDTEMALTKSTKWLGEYLASVDSLEVAVLKVSP